VIRVSAGQKFGRLTFVQILPPSGAGKHRRGRWTCDCGNTAEAALSRVKAGRVSSCGCLVAEAGRAANTVHGGRYTPEYSSWRAMKERCLNPRSKDFPQYGCSGITVCKEWQESFEAFLAHIGPRPAGTTLDRKDGARGYKPGNVRWATAVVQNRNKATFVVIQTPAGQMPLVDYAKSIGITKGAAHQRLKRGKLEGCSPL